MFKFQKISQNLIKNLPQRTKDIIEQRFGLKTGKRKTLEAIGQNYGITRERVRQIESVGFSKISPKIKKIDNIFTYFTDELKKSGNLRRETILLDLLGQRKFQNHVFFLLTLGERFERFYQTNSLYSLWTIDKNSVNVASDLLNFLNNRFQKINRPLTLEEIAKLTNSDFKKSLASSAISSYIEVSKRIKKGPEGAFGLTDWSEINPRGVKDRAYLVFKKEGKPLHFRELTELINKSEFDFPRALPQTVHNELIKDDRFVLVGRGLYALAEWGYKPGVVKDVIADVLRKAKKPLSKKEVVEMVSQRRLVKKSTILLNLNNREYFLKNSRGKYTLN